ncbi:MAG: hemin receptor [Anaerolineae bacterium]|nr:hemin receptor [Anaerolineae bacterium]
MLTEEQRILVTESFASLVPITNEAAAIFYSHLWEIAPETKALFANSDMTQLGIKLMQTLGVAVRAIHDQDTIAPFLRDLGRRHLGYGVHKEQYTLVELALLRMIGHCLGDNFTPQVREAWVAAYAYIAEIANSVYEDSTAS